MHDKRSSERRQSTSVSKSDDHMVQQGHTHNTSNKHTTPHWANGLVLSVWRRSVSHSIVEIWDAVCRFATAGAHDNYLAQNSTCLAIWYATTADMTTRCAFKIEDPSRGPGRSILGPWTKDTASRGPRNLRSRGTLPNLICGTPL